MMIDKVNLSTYYKMARINHSLNSFIREALVTKSQISSTISGSTDNSLSSMMGIGKNIDIFA